MAAIINIPRNKNEASRFKAQEGSSCVEEDGFTVWVHLVCRVFGILPLGLRSVPDNNERRMWKVTYSPVWTMYGGMVRGTLFLLLPLECYKFATESAEVDSILVEVAHHVVLVLVTLTLEARGTSRRVHTYLQSMAQFHKANSFLWWAPADSQQVSRTWRAVLAALVGLPLGLAGMTISILVYKIFSETNDPPAQTFFTNELSYMVTSVLVVRLLNSLYPLILVFRRWGLALRHIHQQFEKYSLTTVGGSGLVAHNQLTDVVEARHLITRASFKLMQSESASIFMVILLVIFRSIFYIKYFALSAANSPPGGLVMRAAYAIAEMLKLYSLTEVCHQLSLAFGEQNRIFSELLSKLKGHPRCWKVRQDLKYCMKSGRLRPLVLSALGIFPVNRELIGLVTGMILTHVLILIQIG